ncbi:MAG: site-specific DNA-methyltransferase [Phycisphaerales bacterium]|nr:site-specific DNA-methyltransferase [Phycisphaerales bacterium]
MNPSNPIKQPDAKTEGSSANIVDQNIATLRQLFPDAFTESSKDDGQRFKVDIEALKQLLGIYSEEQPERYSFTWNGKSKARRVAQTPSTGALRPVSPESADWDSTRNLFIEGDNLEVLKLLQKAYHRRVKMIYIDPPYNTGGDFIYPDDYTENIGTYLRYTGQISDSGFRVSANAETSGRFHTNWLNMMLPRLKLARNLLRDDGVLFVTIDDHEVHNLRYLCDEVFGEENFLASIAWKKRSSPDARSTIGNVHDWILCYLRNGERPKAAIGKMPLSEQRRDAYSNPDEDPRGSWASVDMTGMTGRATKDQFFKVKLPSGRVIGPPEGRSWGLAEATFDELRADNRIWFGATGDSVPRIKKFLDESDGQVAPSFWSIDDVGSNDEASAVLTELMGVPKLFDTPKPPRLIRRMLELATTSGGEDIVLDFFAGSATTAQAVLESNEEDGGNRRFILVQLPERCPPESEAAKAGYETIAAIGRERIRRVTKQIKAKRRASKAETLPLGDAPKRDMDLGFRAYSLDSSNIKPWDADFDTLEQAVYDSVENIKADRTEQDVLTELLLKYGLDLCVPIEERKIAGKTVFSVGAGALMICLDKKITLDVVEGIAKLKDELKPEIMRVVFRDSGFKDDVVKTNAVQILKQVGLSDEHIRSI